jgi:hypothetical protein
MNDQNQQRAASEVSADQSQGVMVGDQGMQVNLWLREREHLLDVEKFNALNAAARASFLCEKAAQDLLGAALVLDRADVSNGAQALMAILRQDRHRHLAISLLTHLNTGKADDLIAAIGPGAAHLKDLPEAAEAIAACEMPSDLGDKVGPLLPAIASWRKTSGFYQSFTNGQIHWCSRGGAYATVGPMSRYHIDGGGSGGRLGFPVSPPMDAVPSSPFGTEGFCQRFESSWDYGHWEGLGAKCGASVYWSSKHDAHATWGGIGEYYEQRAGTAGPLGFPVSDETEVKGLVREDGSQTVGWCQRFEGGVVYWSEKTKAIFVPNAVAEHHENHGGVFGRLGFPVSPEITARESPYGVTGRFQRFEARRDYDREILDKWSESEGPGGATIYVSDAHGAQCVGWGNGHKYELLDATRSWLGFPKSEELKGQEWGAGSDCTVQEFESGAIFFKPGYGSVPVPGPTMDLFALHPGLRQRLGFPVAGERSLDSADQERVQFFEHGLVTFRDGKAAAWVSATG